MAKPKRPKHTQKWQAVYKSTMMWQRRAKAKERRMKAKGWDISGITVTKNPAELQKMNIHQLEKYRHSLNVFSDVNTKFAADTSGYAYSEKDTIPLEDGSRIPVRDWMRANRLVDKMNIERKKLQDETYTADVPKRYRSNQIHRHPRYNPYTGEKMYVGADESISGIRYRYKLGGNMPASAKAFYKWYDKTKEANRRGMRGDLNQARENAKTIAAKMGWEEVVDKLDKLPDNVLYYLIHNEDLFGWLNAWYDENMSEGMDLGYYSPADMDPGGFAEAEQNMQWKLDQWNEELTPALSKYDWFK